MNKPRNKFLTLLALVCALVFFSQKAQAQTTAFTYQGRLSDGAAAASGSYDLGFALFDAASGGTQIGTTLTRPAVAVSNGIFTVTLDFGASPFAAGANRFLEIAVKRPADATFTTLAPRQQINSAPYAIRTLSAATADTAANATNLGGTAANQFVQTNDSRLSDARTPTANSNNYIQNTLTQQTASFNISGTGRADTLNAATAYFLGGNQILTSNVGFGNLSVGTFTGSSATNSGNSFFGHTAGFKNTTGDSNSFLGNDAGFENTAGSRNIFVGRNTGGTNTTGSDNTIIGYNADVGGSNLNFATAIGSGVTVDSSNTIALGRTVDTVRTPGLTRAGNETGTSQSPALNLGIYNGLVTRRIASTNAAAGQIIARAETMTLERDGTVAGLRVSYTSSQYPRSILCMGVNPSGTVVGARFVTPLNAAGTGTVYANSANIEYAQCTFGDSFNNNHLTQVVLQRQTGDNYFVGTVTSSINQ